MANNNNYIMKTLRVVIMLLGLATVVSANAQTASEWLKDAVKAVSEPPAVAADYTVSSPSGTTTGKLMMQKDCFKAEGPDVCMWFDGSTLWTLDTEARTTYISEPTQDDLTSINPVIILRSLPSSYIVSDLKTSDKHTARILLTAKAPGVQYTQVDIELDRQSKVPTKINAVSRDGIKITVHLTNFRTLKQQPQAQFRYNSKDHQGVELVDMR